MAIPDESRMSERGLHSGPQAGGYISMPFTMMLSGAGVENIDIEWKTPFACRIVHVTQKTDNRTAVSNWFVTTTAGNVIAARTTTATMEEFFPGGSLDLDAVDAANRVLARGDTLTVNVTTDAAGKANGFCCVVTVYPTGHPSWDPDLD